MAYDYFNKPTSLSFSSRTKKSLDDLEKDENFLEVSERFLGSIGRESDDVFEYLRDSDFNLVSGMSRAIESGNFNNQEKKDYAYLKKKGVKKIFGPGTIVIKAAIDILKELLNSGNKRKIISLKMLSQKNILQIKLVNTPTKLAKKIFIG